MPRTSGPILNNGLATTLVFEIRNSSTVPIPMVQVEGFVITGSGLPKTPFAHEEFAVPPLANITKTYNITGALAFEVQADTTSASDFTANLFTLDAGGNLIDAQRILGSETVLLAAFTPVP